MIYTPIGRTHLLELLAQALPPRLLGVQQLARVHQHHLEVARRRPVCPPPTPTQREREEGGARSDHSVSIEAMQSHSACLLVTVTRHLPCTYVRSTSSSNSLTSAAVTCPACDLPACCDTALTLHVRQLHVVAELVLQLGGQVLLVPVSKDGEGRGDEGSKQGSSQRETVRVRPLSLARGGAVSVIC